MAFLSLCSSSFHPLLPIRIVDALMEEILQNFELNDYYTQQRQLLYIKYLGKERKERKRTKNSLISFFLSFCCR
jgi:hypothetical protein